MPWPLPGPRVESGSGDDVADAPLIDVRGPAGSGARPLPFVSMDVLTEPLTDVQVRVRGVLVEKQLATRNTR